MFLSQRISEVYQQLQEYDRRIFGSMEQNGVAAQNQPPFSFGFSKPSDPPTPFPVFKNTGGASIFSQAPFDIPSQEFTFGAAQSQKNTSGDNNVPAVKDIAMDGS